MSMPTWGVYIPGYSYPSMAQRKKFDRMYPGKAAEIEQDRDQALENMFAEQQRLADADRKRRASCQHLFVPTNIDDNHVCKHCGMWVEANPACKC